MKTLLMLLVAALLISLPVMGQDRKSGDIAALFTFNGFSNLSVSGMNGGAGGRLWFAPALSVRATLGTIINNGDNSAKTVSTSGALLITWSHTKNTQGYIGPQIRYTHTDPSENPYSASAVLGFQFSPWDNVSFGSEYELGFEKYGDNTKFVFGQTTGAIILEIGL